MDDLEQERQRKRQQALEEYQKIISFEISPAGREKPVIKKRRRFFRFRNCLLLWPSFLQPSVISLSANSCRIPANQIKRCKKNCPAASPKSGNWRKAYPPPAKRSRNRSLRRKRLPFCPMSPKTSGPFIL